MIEERTEYETVFENKKRSQGKFTQAHTYKEKWADLRGK